jgi:hypothetical protein
VQITAADIDRLNPPTEAADLIRLAAEHGHEMWHTRGPIGTASQLRISGLGWDLQANWASRDDAPLTLRSMLLWQDATGEWTTLPGLDEARDWIRKD